MEQKEPKFEIGDKVSMKVKTLYGETHGEVVEAEKEFLELDRFGNFREDGLIFSEREIDSIALPYTFDGETLTIEQPQREYSIVYKFSGYGYTIKTPKSLTSYPENYLKKI
jgi:hypothetical protein